MSDAPRQHSIAWSDPAALAAAGRTMSGMEFLTAMAEGRLPPPPALLLIGARMGSIEEGRVTMRLVPAEYQFNPLGTVHGGILATLLDSVMGCAVHSRLPAGRGYTTLEFKVNFLRGVGLSTGEVMAEGNAVHLGRRSAVAEGRILDGAGRPCATASTTCIIFE
ncbi:PaaI family thioesterase [Roseomonas sp. CCTCC AB2023176]|uniref:PaaI family thioesterase n=1 Tax=Roseomonas sp. CCTCC AB2023176 TaxID=3342640 RepID=UPI0035DE5FBC